jgi:hypothetical protein
VGDAYSASGGYKIFTRGILLNEIITGTTSPFLPIASYANGKTPSGGEIA